jgi:hypothetical protein
MCKSDEPPENNAPSSKMLFPIAGTVGIEGVGAQTHGDLTGSIHDGNAITLSDLNFIFSVTRIRALQTCKKHVFTVIPLDPYPDAW